MKKTAILIISIVSGLALYGCGGKDPAADGGQRASLQDMTMSGEGIPEERSAGGSRGEIQPGGVTGEILPEEAGTMAGIPESPQPAVYEPAEDLRNRDLEEIKQYLAQYPNSLQELSEKECYVVLHGQEYSGRDYLDSFMGKVQTEIPGELVIVQFTVEGDPVLIYLNYNGENVYCMEDASRDAWAGSGEKYFEKDYDSVWLSGEVDTEGNHYLSLYALQEQDMVVEVFSAATEDPLMCGLPIGGKFCPGSGGADSTAPALAGSDSAALDPAGSNPAASDLTAPSQEPIESKLPLIKENILDEPPRLTVICDETAMGALRGSYSWQKRNSDGTSTATEADSTHPLDCEDLLPAFEVVGTMATLRFTEDPDEIVSIRCRSEDHWGDSEADSESVTADGYEIELKPGGTIYEVIAEWGTEKSGYGGVAHYSFYIKTPE